MAITVIFNKPDGAVETLALDPPAALQAGPGVIFEFPDLYSSQVEFQAAGTQGRDLSIVLPNGGGQITLLGFQELLFGEDKAAIRWGGGSDTIGLDGVAAAVGAKAAAFASLLDSLMDYLTNLRLEDLMNLRLSFRGNEPDDRDRAETEFDSLDPFLRLAEFFQASNNQGDGAASGGSGAGPPRTTDLDADAVAKSDAESGATESLIGSVINYLTNLSLEALMTVRVGFRDADAGDQDGLDFDLDFPNQTGLQGADGLPTNLQGDGRPPVRTGGGLPLTPDFDDGFADFGNTALSDDSQDQDPSPGDGSAGLTNEGGDGTDGGGTDTVSVTVTAVNLTDDTSEFSVGPVSDADAAANSELATAPTMRMGTVTSLVA